MDAKFLRLAPRLSIVALFAFAAACSKKNAAPIDPQEKKNFLASAAALQLKKAYCLPNPILDEEDIVPLLQDGYKLSTEDNYCIPEPDGTFDFGDYNCVPYKFVDQYDRVYLLANDYRDTGTEYCNDKPDDGNNGGDGETTAGGNTTGTTTGGSTTSDSTTGGGSTTSDSTNGGSTNSDSGNTSGSVTGGSDGGSTTSDSTNGGGSITGGSTNNSGGSDSGGATTSDSTNGGSTTSGSVSGGSDNGGSTTSTTGSSTNGGSTTSDSTNGGGSTIGSTMGGSDGGANTSDNTNGGNTNSDTNGGSTTGTTSGGSDNGSTSGSSNGSTTGSTDGGSTTGGTCHDDHEWKAPIDRLCSKIRTGNGKYILKERKELVVQVLHRVKDKKTKKIVSTLVCESKNTDKIKDDILNKHKVDLDDCNLHGYKKSELFLTIFSPVVSKDLPISTYDYMYVRFFKKGSDVNGKEELSFLNYGSRDNRYVPLNEKIIVIVNNNPDNSNVSEKECDAKASPLVVHVNPEHDVPKYVELTSNADGVKFDILGLNAEPKAHTPYQVGWLANDQYMFLVKPNKKGLVKGINEMFGDNTFGPDRDFSPNGFLALAKYDKNQDGVIDSDDSVYNSLRLWFDKNHDGIGTPNEMVTLSQMKVQTIDLRYDASFREKDRYGNETVYKSVIQYEDGSLDLIFDLWFNYKSQN